MLFYIALHANKCVILERFRQEASRNRDRVEGDDVVVAAPHISARAVSDPVLNAHAPVVRPAPAVRRPSGGDEVAAMREEMRHREHQHQQELYQLQQQRHADNLKNLYLVSVERSALVYVYLLWLEVILTKVCTCTGKSSPSAREQIAGGT